ncbi:hypothetical protein PHO31112_01135 [Pandoraea horticolens]|uniref:Uncharacterized protein n=1 Tax=Pandoraea horticolens TaxID=2508298 RepID=A0A5E4T5E0_9BURK|nr:hypothetical protein [Pandoraea horticolens]VVD81674.1 hypothetical protein PHO31112_01135 [Pandoraea horticolens]
MFVIFYASGVTSLSAKFTREARMAAGSPLGNADHCCLSATNRNLRKLFTQFSEIPLLLFSLSFLKSRNRIQAVLGGQHAEAGGHAMFKITVKTMRSATFSLAAACFASAAQADITGIAGVPVAVSDMLLASTRAANLQQSVVANLSGTAPVVVAPVNATTTTANNVRLWDEVIPPAPAPKPTQASATFPAQPHPAVTASAYSANSPNSPPSLASGLQTTSLKGNANVGRVPVGIAR